MERAPRIVADRHTQTQGGPDPNLAPEGAPTTPVRSSGVRSPIDRRLVLWRDSATILIFVVIGLLGAQTFLPHDGATPTDTSLPSGIVTGSLPPGATLPPGVTFGPIIDPSLGIDATATPIPVITLGPSPSPSPSPTLKPSLKPTSKPSVAPTASPTDTPAPPVAQFNWSPLSPVIGESVTFTSTSTGATSWAWDFGDGVTSTEQIPTHPYAAASLYTVTLTVTGPGGSDSKPQPLTVTLPTAPP